MSNGKELKVYLKETIEGYAEDVFNSDKESETKKKVFFNKLTRLDGYFEETEYSKEWYQLAFSSALNGDEEAKVILGLN